MPAPGRRRGEQNQPGHIVNTCSMAGLINMPLSGAYSVSNNVGDGIVMWVFGVVGYFLRKFDYDAAPLILAMVIGPMMEESLRQSLIISAGP